MSKISRFVCNVSQSLAVNMFRMEFLRKIVLAFSACLLALFLSCSAGYVGALPADGSYMEVAQLERTVDGRFCFVADDGETRYFVEDKKADLGAFEGRRCYIEYEIEKILSEKSYLIDVEYVEEVRMESLLLYDGDVRSSQEVAIAAAWFSGEYLNLVCSYSGGNERHDFVLFAPTMLDSISGMAEVGLLHHADSVRGNTYQRTVLSYDLSELIAKSDSSFVLKINYLRDKNSVAQTTVHVDVD